MLLKLMGFCVFMGLLSQSMAFKIVIDVIDGNCDSLNVPTTPFVKIGNDYYYFERKVSKNWYGAYQSCIEKNASLIAYESAEELRLIHDYTIKEKFAGIFWTSGSDQANEGNYIWFPKGNTIPSNFWAPGEPNNNNGIEHCVDVRNAKLNDFTCQGLKKYICKAPRPKTVCAVIV